MNITSGNEVAEKTYSYREYKQLVEELVANNTTSGSERTPARIEFTKLNLQRMNRLDKQTKIRSELATLVSNIKKGQHWMIIAEAWCGDGAQLIPIIAKAAEINPLIELQIVMRDDNPDIMDKYLTNGARAIPKLAIKDKETGEDLAVWGPRPTAISKMVRELKAVNPDVPKEEFEKHLHLWYARDKGQAMQTDLIEILTNLNNL